MQPEFKNKAKSIERVESLLLTLPSNEPIDLIVLPELALIGYKFDSKDDIAPYTELVPDNLDDLITSLDTIKEVKEVETCTFKLALKISRKFP